MIASLFLDPNANYIKVNYFPEEPKRGLINYVYHRLDDGGWMVTVKKFPHTTGSGNTKEEALKSILENIELIKKFEEGKYQDALTAARASAVKVKDQEQAKRIILNQYEPEKCRLSWCVDGGCLNQCAKYKSLEPNVLYPIPGLTFKEVDHTDVLPKAAAKACMPFVEKAYDAAYFQSANDRSKEVSYYRYADRKEKWLKGNIGG